MRFLAVIFVFLFFFSCGNYSNKTTTEDEKIMFSSYYNERFEFGLDYPDFLIPQGESDNGDGQKFISDDGLIQMWAYIDYKMNKTFDGVPSVDEAYEADKNMDNVIKSLEEYNYYYIYGKIDDKTLFAKYTFFHNLNYLVLYFQYPISEDSNMESLIKTVVESFYFNEHSDYNVMSYIRKFIDACWIDKNFNLILKNDSEVLESFVDSDLGLCRLYSPGAIPRLATKKDNYGFDEYTDFTSKFTKKYYVHEYDPSIPLCELDFGEDFTLVYYQFVNELPNLVDPETFEISSLNKNYPKADFMVLYLPDKYENPRALYFIFIHNKWKLIIIDDTLCSA